MGRTLVDSVSFYKRTFVNTLSPVFDADPKQLGDLFTASSGKSLHSQIVAAAQIGKKEIQDTKKLEQKFWENLGDFTPLVLPGAKEFLIKLKEKGLKVAVWSGTRDDVLKKTIEHVSFSPFIDFSIGNRQGSDVFVKGPKLFEVIADHFGLITTELAKTCLVIGDGSGDIEAGKRIGARVGGFGNNNKNDTHLSGADFVFQTYQELLAKFPQVEG
ncbi:MAG TPA: HAD hydrolase-like protein [Candidatus Saccharimonadales bacterium]|nr:HAD hydrolase-like protein [Candidatus Saccharimonadales bacterium]